MSVAAASAVSYALDLVKVPAAVPAARAARFPTDITTLLRLVAMDSTTIEQSVTLTGESEAQLLDAAEFFVLQVCFTPGIDSYRILGANRDDPIARIREHYRLLVRWLHPDRNSDAWQTVFLDRVNGAWRDLRSADGRAEYDRIGPAHPDADEDSRLVAGMPLTVAGLAGGLPMGKRMSARTMRRLPTFVLGGLGVVAAVILGLMYVAHDEEVRELAPRVGLEDQSSVPFSGEVLPRDPSADFMRAAETVPVDSVQLLPSAALEESVPPLPPTAAVSMTQQSPAAEHNRVRAKSVDGGSIDIGSIVTASGGAPSIDALAIDPGLTDPPLIAPVAKPTVVRPEPDTLLAEVSPASIDVAKARVSTRADLPSASSPSTSPASDQSVQTPTAIASSAEQATTPESVLAAENLPTGTDTDVGGSDDELLVDELLRQFRNAYDQGDLIRLMALFTRDARNVVDGSKRLADDYRELFKSSQARHLLLRDRSWWREGDMVAVVATFDASITPIGSVRSRRIGGDIRFELRREDGAVRIARIRHQAE